jgi:hypothetical protein
MTDFRARQKGLIDPAILKTGWKISLYLPQRVISRFPKRRYNQNILKQLLKLFIISESSRNKKPDHLISGNPAVSGEIRGFPSPPRDGFGVICF